MTAGVNRFTGAPLAGWSHVVQSLNVIFTTRLGSRVLRRTFGSAVPGLLGQPLTDPLLVRFYMAVVIAIELWEPRFRVISVRFPKDQNSAAQLGQGRFGVVMLGNYRPNALEGDFTVAAVKSVII